MHSSVIIIAIVVVIGYRLMVIGFGAQRYGYFRLGFRFLCIIGDPKQANGLCLERHIAFFTTNKQIKRISLSVNELIGGGGV